MYVPVHQNIRLQQKNYNLCTFASIDYFTKMQGSIVFSNQITFTFLIFLPHKKIKKVTDTVV